MATFSEIRPGQTLYTMTRQKAGNTTVMREAWHPVLVKQVDPEGRYVVASWNGNDDRKFYSIDVTKWHTSMPAKTTAATTAN